MKKITLSLTFTVLFCTFLFAQTETSTKRKAVYAEFLGSGVFGSVNYDFRFTEKNNGLGLRIGAGMVPDVLVIPVEINGLAGRKKVVFEYGLGISNGLFLNNKHGNDTFPSGISRLGFLGYAKAGFRLQPKNDGLFFNFNWNPIINKEEIRWLWFGIGIGYSWK